MNKFAAFAGGVLFGTAGLKVLASRDAKKVYVHTTAAALRARDCVMATAHQGGRGRYSCRGEDPQREVRRRGREGSH